LSTALLALGLMAGLVLNVVRQSSNVRNISWTDPVVLSSSVLFVWLAVATLFESLYRPAREGHKVAYITLVSFVFLGLVLILVLSGRHGIVPAGSEAAPLEQRQASAFAVEQSHHVGGAE